MSEEVRKVPEGPVLKGGDPSSRPPGILVPRHSRIRRFNKTAPAMVVMLLVVVVAGLGYEFVLTQKAVQPRAQRDMDDGHTAELAEILSKAPAGDVIPADSGSATPAASVGQQALPPPPASSQAEPGMTHAEIEGRRQIWNTYFQGLDDARQKQLTAVYDALSADTETVSTSSPRHDSLQSASPDVGGEVPNQDDVNDTAAGEIERGAGEQARAGRGRDFFDRPGATAATDYLHTAVTDPISPYELKATDIIDARMISGLTSDSHGVVRAMVSKNVFDHATGLHILIPQGSQLAGVYNTEIGYGQKRVEVAWQRVIYPAPCDQSLDLGQMPGSDQSGYSGFHDITDNHYNEVFLNAILLSVFSAAAQVSQQGNYSGFGGYSASQVAAGAIGQQLATLGAEFARRGLDIPPTETVRNGYPFTIMITKDIAFAVPWVAGKCGGQEVTVAQR